MGCYVDVIALLAAANRANMDLQDAKGKTALYYAVHGGQWQVDEL